MNYKKIFLDLGVSALVYFPIYYGLSLVLEWFVAGFFGFMGMMFFRKPIMDYLEERAQQKNQKVNP